MTLPISEHQSAQENGSPPTSDAPPVETITLPFDDLVKELAASPQWRGLAVALREFVSDYREWFDDEPRDVRFFVENGERRVVFEDDSVNGDWNTYLEERGA